MQARLLASKGQVREALNATRALIQLYVSNPAGGYGLAQEAMKMEADLRIRIGDTATAPPPVPTM
jgi:signal transduction histidine kinase